MAYWIQDENKQLGRFRHNFICETSDDINKLPTRYKAGELQIDDTSSSKQCQYGSRAYVISDGSKHILDKTSDSWIKLPDNSLLSGVINSDETFLTIDSSDNSDNESFLTDNKSNGGE